MLNTLFNNKIAHSTPATRNLPNGGGSYQIPEIFRGLGDSAITPPPAVEQPIFNQQSPVLNQESPVATQKSTTRSKYMNPTTGKYFTPEEYANSVAMKIPASKGTGDIPQYAGDAMANPNESSEKLATRATNLNNTRNDIATGTTDPYKVGKDSGIAYSPSELAAIENAYAGIYDPALNDVFSRMKTREDADKRDQDREDEIFSTNENIRQWRETTGTKSTSGGDRNTVDIFTNTQLNDGAGRANMSIDDFRNLDSDIANYYVNPPTIYNPDTGKNDLISNNFEEIKLEIKNGDLTNAEAAKEIMEGDLPEAVKVYLVNQLPATKEEKNNWISWIWNRMPFID